MNDLNSNILNGSKQLEIDAIGRENEDGVI